MAAALLLLEGFSSANNEVDAAVGSGVASETLSFAVFRFFRESMTGKDVENLQRLRSAERTLVDKVQSPSSLAKDLVYLRELHLRVVVGGVSLAYLGCMSKRVDGEDCHSLSS